MSYQTYEVRVFSNGSKEWFQNDQRHREDGPAIEWTNGTKEWFKNGQLHREDGPAYETNGYKSWYQNGQYHREDGPAIECADGYKAWFLNGKELSEQEFNERMNGPCTNKIIEIDGKKYKLTEVE